MGTRVCVCLKVVPRAEVQLRLDDASRRLDRSGASDINPPDEYAIEEALAIAGQLGGGVVAVSMLPETATETLRHALALGVDRGIAISDPSLEDRLVVTSRVLARVLQLEAPEVIVVGSQSIDGRGAMLGAALAERLGFPVISGVRNVQVIDGRIRATRQTSVSEVVLDAPTPCVVALSGSANTPRYPSFREVVTAKRKEITVLSAADLGLTPSEVGWAGARTRVLGLSPRPARRAEAEIWTGEEGAAQFLTDFFVRRGLM